MGLFNSYTKPGPGVNKNAPKKKGIFLFLEVLKRKFFKLMQANMLYILFSIPMIAVLMYFSIIIISNSIGEMDMTDQALIQSFNQLQFMVTMFVLMLWGSGPASAGFAYIFRCFTREEHAWIMADFWGKFKENFKQAIIVVIVDIVLLFLGVNAIRFYFLSYMSSHSVIWLVLSYVSVIMMVLYTFMHYYIYQLMVTFDSKLREHYRNAFILAIGKAPMNLLLTIISTVLGVFIYQYLQAPFAFLLSFLLFNGLGRFPLEFYAARTIQKIILNNMDTPPVEESEEDRVFSDEIKYTED